MTNDEIRQIHADIAARRCNIARLQAEQAKDWKRFVFTAKLFIVLCVIQMLLTLASIFGVK